MPECYICTKTITRENRSKEHLIPNSCGGRLCSKKLICKECNSKIGQIADADLAKQVAPFMNLLNLSRSRGETPPIQASLSASGRKIKLTGWTTQLSSPIIKRSNNGFYVSARNEEELQYILNGLCKKYPIDLNKIEKQNDISDTVEIEFSLGADGFAALTKIAVNFYIHSGGNRRHIEHLIPYIQGQETFDDIVYFHYPTPEIYTPQIDEISHVIKIIANPKEKILFAYIELFNSYNVLVKLNDNYLGEEFDSSYIYDLIKHKESNHIHFFPQYTKRQIIDYIKTKNCPSSELRNSLARMLMKAYDREFLRSLNDKINMLRDEVLKKYPPETMPTEATYKNDIDEFMKKIMPLLLWRENYLRAFAELDGRSRL